MLRESNPIEIRGPIGTLVDGYARHNRAFVKMCLSLGLNIKPYSLEQVAKGVPMSEDKELIDLLTVAKSMPVGNTVIHFCIPPTYKLEPNKIHIGFATWETHMLPASWVTPINTLKAIFVPSKAVKEVFLASGVTIPIYILPFPLNPEMYNTGDKISVMPAEHKGCTFMYSAGFVPRKNFEDLIMAFCDVFDQVDDVALVIKTSAPGNDMGTRQKIQESIKSLTNKMNGCVSRPKVYVVTDQVEDSEMLGILNSCDVYCSSSRGEGLDITMVQAMALGKIVVSDTFLGHGDYITNENAVVFRNGYVPVVNSGVPFHNSKHKWSSPDYMSLCDALMKAYNLYKSSSDIGLKAKESVLAKYSEAIVFKEFNEILDKIIGPDEKVNRTRPWSAIPKVSLK